MELDDLKSAWKRQDASAPGTPDVEGFRQIIQRSNNGLSRMMFWESLLGAAVVVFFLITVFFFDFQMKTFYIKLTLPVILYAIPVYYRLYRSLRFLRSVDYSKDMRSTLTDFLRYYTQTIRLYVWGGYIAVLTIYLLFFTDEKFLSLSIWWKAVIVGYMGIAMLAIKPFAQRFYGRRADAIRQYLDDQETTA